VLLVFVRSGGAARAGSEERSHRGRVEALAYEKRKEPAIFGGTVDGTATMTDATVERTFHQLALIHIFEDVANRAAGNLSIDTHRLELTHRTRPAVTLHERVRARKGQCCPAII